MPGRGPAWAVVDGDSALGMVTSVFAMTTGIGKARQAGVGYVGVRNGSHFGAAGGRILHDYRRAPHRLL
ncbi:MAG TPA: Ldh family oxidoreductase [Streptosporangiaceae bacterium]|nr:Ldh family oxidoreductase [Streptosporangiaceae bacterium]